MENPRAESSFLSPKARTLIIKPASPYSSSTRQVTECDRCLPKVWLYGHSSEVQAAAVEHWQVWDVPGNAEECQRRPFQTTYLAANYVRQNVGEEMYLKGHKRMPGVCVDFFLLWECSSPLESVSSFGSLASDMVHPGCNNWLLSLVQDSVVSQYRKCQMLT